MFKVGDIVWVSNPDKAYEDEYGGRVHRKFFGKVVEVNAYTNETVVIVDFDGDKWAYDSEELALAKVLNDLTLEEFSNRFGLAVNGVFI